MVSPESLGPVTWFSLPVPSSQDRLIHGSSWSWTYVRTPVDMLFLVLQIVFADGSFECDNLTEWYVRLWFVDKFILNTLEIPVFHSTQGPLWSWAYIFQQLASKMQNGRILLVHFWSSSLYRILSPTALGEIHCYPLIVLPNPQPLQIVLVMGLSSQHLRVIYLVGPSKSINQLHLSASNADRIEQTFPS